MHSDEHISNHVAASVKASARLRIKQKEYLNILVFFRMHPR
jgi:hypothetical protein